jgi:hypothetical protein
MQGPSQIHSGEIQAPIYISQLPGFITATVKGTWCKTQQGRHSSRCCETLHFRTRQSDTAPDAHDLPDPFQTFVRSNQSRAHSAVLNQSPQIMLVIHFAAKKATFRPENK